MTSSPRDEPTPRSSRRRRAGAVIFVIALGVVALGALSWEPVYWWIVTERFYAEQVGDDDFGGHTVRGFHRVRRGSLAPYGEIRMWYVENGMMAAEGEVVAEGAILGTIWTIDGEISQQIVAALVGPVPAEEHRREPPWEWGVEVQTRPTMPGWMRNDDQWMAVMKAQSR